MEGAEGPAHHFAVAAILVDLKQRRFQFHQKLAGFFPERLFVFVDHPSTLLTTASNCCVAKGFTIQPVAPAALPSNLRDSWDSVVSMMMGSPLQEGSARTLRISPIPSRLGILRSVITRFTGCASFFRASLPSTASITV